jgi:hypothetical protein
MRGLEALQGAFSRKPPKIRNKGGPEAAPRPLTIPGKGLLMEHYERFDEPGTRSGQDRHKWAYFPAIEH